jgi:hypothetical protein
MLSFFFFWTVCPLLYIKKKHPNVNESTLNYTRTSLLEFVGDLALALTFDGLVGVVFGSLPLTRTLTPVVLVKVVVRVGATNLL